VEEGLLLAVDPIILTNILLQTPHSQFPLVLSEPASGTGKVGQDENGGKGNHNGDGTLDDEQPAPGTETLDIVHVVGYTGRNQTGESAREQRTGVEGSGTEAQFLPGIPGTKEVQAAGL